MIQLMWTMLFKIADSRLAGVSRQQRDNKDYWNMSNILILGNGLNIHIFISLVFNIIQGKINKLK